SILAVKLGLTETLPDVDGNGQALSRTDQILTEWSYRNPHGSTVFQMLFFWNEKVKKGEKRNKKNKNKKKEKVGKK
uniref:Uncharacterized protein n=1 Tax=Romanomermis culicivorax TaxID=13658 RepID=A0A915KR63_ROMCU